MRYMTLEAHGKNIRTLLFGEVLKSVLLQSRGWYMDWWNTDTTAYANSCLQSAYLSDGKSECIGASPMRPYISFMLKQTRQSFLFLLL